LAIVWGGISLAGTIGAIILAPPIGVVVWAANGVSFGSGVAGVIFGWKDPPPEYQQTRLGLLFPYAYALAFLLKVVFLSLSVVPLTSYYTGILTSMITAAAFLDTWAAIEARIFLSMPAPLEL